jgi:hypothetical protein
VVSSGRRPGSRCSTRRVREMRGLDLGAQATRWFKRCRATLIQAEGALGEETLLSQRCFRQPPMHLHSLGLSGSHGSRIAGPQLCKIGIVSRPGYRRLPPVAGRAVSGERGKASQMKAPIAPKLGTAYDIRPRQAIRDCSRGGHLEKVAQGSQTAYDRTGNES